MTPSRIVQTCAKRALKDLPLLSPAPNKAQADYAVACFKNLPWFGVPIFKIAEQAREEIRDAVQPLIKATIGKTLDHFPAHVRREHGIDNVRISARLKPAHGHDVFAFGLRFHRACLFSFHIAISLETNN